MNKKGQIEGVFYLALAIMVVIGLALLVGIGTGVITFMSSTINEATAGLGMVGDSNLTAVQAVTVGTMDNIIQTFKFLSAFLIIIGLLGTLIFAAFIRTSPNGFMIGFWILLVVIMIIGAIFVSNAYEEFYNGTDEVAIELRSMPITSFLIIYMPHIITTLAFVGGFLIFSGIGEELT